MFDIGRLKDGDTVVISGAAGSVGMVSLSSFTDISQADTFPSIDLSQFCPVAGRNWQGRSPQLKCLSQIATQIALAHRKCRVIAIAGAPEKLDQLKQLGCHEVLNYKDADFKKKFRKLGLIDLYFDNGESSGL